jgi:predicted RNA-binding Zn-ribbon protein involved in translation (DUF1610 family)
MKYEFDLFLKKKKEMTAEGKEEMRLLERMAKLNPWLVPCPSCGRGMEIHHWEGRGRRKTPFFKCQHCSFIA